MEVFAPSLIRENPVPILNYMGGVGSSSIIDLTEFSGRHPIFPTPFIFADPPYSSVRLTKFEPDLSAVSFSDCTYPDLVEKVLEKARSRRRSPFDFFLFFDWHSLNYDASYCERQVKEYLLKNLPLSIKFILEDVVENPPDKNPWAVPFITTYGFTYWTITRIIYPSVHHITQESRFLPFQAALEQLSEKPSHRNNSGLTLPNREGVSAKPTRSSRRMSLPLRQ
jgi:hypothetical protein